MAILNMQLLYLAIKSQWQFRIMYKIINISNSNKLKIINIDIKIITNLIKTISNFLINLWILQIKIMQLIIIIQMVNKVSKINIKLIINLTLIQILEIIN